MDVKELHPLNKSPSIFSKLAGSVIVFSEVQFSNSPHPNVFTPFWNETFCKLPQFINALYFISFTLLGIETLAKLEQS